MIPTCVKLFLILFCPVITLTSSPSLHFATMNSYPLFSTGDASLFWSPLPLTNFDTTHRLLCTSISQGIWKATLAPSLVSNLFCLGASLDDTGTPSMISGTSLFSCFAHIRSLPWSFFGLFVVGSDDVRHFAGSNAAS